MNLLIQTSHGLVNSVSSYVNIELKCGLFTAKTASKLELLSAQNYASQIVLLVCLTLHV